MLAIPSPDVLMNLFATAAQVMGLLVLCLSGGLLSRRRLPRGGSGRPASRWPLAVAVLAFLGTGAGWLLYHFDVVDQRHRRLQTNLVRSSQEAGKKVGDTSLKTLAYSEQVQHPRGVTTEQMQAWIESGKPMNLIDVREDEEVEMGAIRGSWHRRYPDLQANRDGLTVADRPTILLCESGNRSSELSELFFKEGIVTGFMIGGYEKWVGEDRPMLGLGASDRSDLRAVPEFANKDVLLDTDEATRLYLDANALFVDVRYPQEYEAQHLPGAVNVPLRKLRSDQVATALAALPQRPIVVPCYDKRSSFYALVLGVRLSRAGYDFRGRYTVPEEFTAPQRDAEWVARWKAQNAERTPWGMAQQALVAALRHGQGWFGSLALAIAAAALLLRLLLAPLAIKAERDNTVLRRHGDELQQLKTGLADDPVRLRRAIGDWMRRRRVTPGRNLLGSLVMLLTFTACFAAIATACRDSTEALAWTTLGTADATGVGPLLVGGLLFALVRQQSRSRRLLPLLVGLGFTAAITALVWSCSAGVLLYLAVSFAVLVVQTWLVRRWLRVPGAPRPSPAPIVPLLAAAGRAELGGKATRLGELVAAGFPVPPGFVIAPDHEPSARELDRIWQDLGARPVAVRSSACGEDGAQKSFAGEFRTVLEVTRPGLRQAIADVRRSYRGRSGGVIVQSLVPADHAGVLFTEDPAHAGRALVEMVAGLGEGLVSGTATPHEFRADRVTGAAIGAACEFDLAPLLAMGRRAEALFGGPQDIEWARAGGRFLMLQARPVTRRAGDHEGPVAVRERERARLLAAVAGVAADREVFAAGDYAALLPAPTPYSLALMQAIWAPGGTVDLACRRLGLAFRIGEGAPPYVQSVFGRSMVDQRHDQVLGTSARAAFRLGLAANGIEQTLVAFLAEFRPSARWHAAIDLTRLDDGALHELLTATQTRYLHSTYVEAEIVNIAAEAYFAAARRRLARRGLDAGDLLGQGVHTVVQRAFHELATEAPVAVRRDRFVAAFGHRAAHDFELAEPRFSEVPERVAAMAQATATAAAPAPHAPAPLPGGRLLRTEVQRARRFQELKEEAKDAAMHELALLRRILLAIGARSGLDDLVFWLRPEEVAQLRTDAATAASLRAEAARRRRDAETLLAVPLPDAVSPALLADVGSERPLPALRPAADLRGTRVAGDREVVGRVVVCRDPAAIGDLRPDDVLVTRCTDPCWLPAFGRVRGLVTEVGGWLSHAAIQAREHNLPAIVGASGATHRLRTGDLVCLRADGTVEPIADRRRDPRQPVSIPVRIEADAAASSGRLLDLTDTGAAIAWDVDGPPAARALTLRIGEQEIAASVVWTNCTRFGVRFERPLEADALAPHHRAAAPAGDPA